MGTGRIAKGAASNCMSRHENVSSLGASGIDFRELKVS